jgi:branched-chain amino acid transport system substrate-binding protein
MVHCGSRFTYWCAALLTVLLCTALPSGGVLAQSVLAGAPAKPVRIGLILPLTGGSAGVGGSALIGAQLAVEEINASMGFLGRPIELVIRDDQGKADVGVAAAESLVLKERVVATVGICNTGVAVKAIDVFQKHRHVLMVSCATGTPVTSTYPAKDSFIFRVAAPDILQTEFLAEEIARRKLSKPALLVDTSGYGDAGLVDLQRALKKRGIAPAIVVRIPVGASSYAVEVKRARDSGADSMVSWSVGPEVGLIAKARTEIKWKAPSFGSWTMSHQATYEYSRGAIDGGLMVQTFIPNASLERHISFVSAYGTRDKNSIPASFMSAAQSYDAVNLLIRGMLRTRSAEPDGEAIKQGLENLTRTYAGVLTTYDRPFSSSDHDAITANMLWLGTWRNSERVYFYKDDERRAGRIRHKQSTEARQATTISEVATN